MAKGVFKNNKFRGYYEDRDLFYYTSQMKDVLDYNNTHTVEDRILKVKELLNLDDIGSKDEFWMEVWDAGICKSGLNTSDGLWSETNVCNTLETLGTYLLAKAPKDETEKITIYDDYKLFKRMISEKEKINPVCDSDGDELMVYKKKDNYKLAPKPEIEEVDKDKYPELKAYLELKNYFQKLTYNGKDVEKQIESKKFLKDTVKMINDTKCKGDWKLTESRMYSIAKNNLPLLTDDMLQVKNSYERNIVFKCPLKDSGNEIDWSYLDMFDPKHVRALLQIRRDIDICEDALIDLEGLINNIELDEELDEILTLWRLDKTVVYIADRMKVTDTTINRKLDKIVNKIIAEYEKQYSEKYYYVSVVKGKYKKCSKCGEVKLTKYFDKNGKKGLMSMCKNCRK